MPLPGSDHFLAKETGSACGPHRVGSVACTSIVDKAANIDSAHYVQMSETVTNFHCRGSVEGRERPADYASTPNHAKTIHWRPCRDIAPIVSYAIAPTAT